LHSTFAFNINLRRYIKGALGEAEEAEIEWFMQEVESTWGVVFEPGRTEAGAHTRPLLSST
jgi:hypothetical protein